MRCAIAVVTVALSLLAGDLAAQAAPETDGTRDVRVDRDRPANSPEARRAIGQLKSPYCPGLMLEVCPSQQAVMLRDSIREMALAGHSSDEIVDWMLANHGEEWRAVPRMSGWGIWAWVLPPFVLLVGLGFLVAYLRRHRWHAPEGETGSETAGPSDEDEERLRAAMSAFEEEGR